MLGGRKPARPLDWRELERDAYAMLPRGPRGYIQGGAGLGETIRANREAFDDWRIVPRMLRDVSERSLERTVLGTKLSAPVLLAPIGVQTVAHAEGELASARAAGHVGVPLIASTAASHTIEQIAEAAGEQPCWYQLYWPRDRELARSFIERAEKSGYRALVVTLDTWLLGWRPADLTDGFLPFLRGEGNASYLQDPVFRSALPIQSPEDALLAVEHGIEGLIVSNHGGRQVDGAIGSLQALPGVVEAVGDSCEVLFDSGIRSGADALKALALGARAVCLGRPYVWGLALGGEQGVIEVLRAFLADLDLNMALSGHASIDEVGMHTLVANS